jgi:hypothetical protein
MNERRASAGIMRNVAFGLKLALNPVPETIIEFCRRNPGGACARAIIPLVSVTAFRRLGNIDHRLFQALNFVRERVAQSVEHLTFNQRVVGSSPTALTNEDNDIADKTFDLASQNVDWEAYGKRV